MIWIAVGDPSGTGGRRSHEDVKTRVMPLVHGLVQSA